MTAAADLPLGALPAAAARIVEAGEQAPAATASFVEAGGGPVAVLGWDPPAVVGGPIVLLHGVTSAAGGWWRVGPALAATGRPVRALDLPGHGATPARPERSFGATAALVAEAIRGLGLAGPAREAPDVSVIGHSWGALIAAHLPAAGLVPGRIVLLDPPVLDWAGAQAIADGSVRIPGAAAALAHVDASYPEWPPGDRAAKAAAIATVDLGLVRDVMLGNRWDAGLDALDEAHLRGTSIRVVRADPAAGGLLPAESVPALESRFGPGSLESLAGAGHSPHRTHPVATIAALLRALA